MKEIELLLLVIVLADLMLNLWFWKKSAVNKAEFELLLEIARQRAQAITPQDIDFQDKKATANSADLIKEVTDLLEAITLYKSRKVLIEISNGVAGGFVIKTKFGSN